MENGLKQKLELVGVKVDSALERFLGNEALYWKFALKFLEDKNVEMLAEAYKNQDIEAAFMSAHNLKGICGNLSFEYLYQNASDMTELLRSGNFEEAKKIFPEFRKNYQVLTEILREYN